MQNLFKLIWHHLPILVISYQAIRVLRKSLLLPGTPSIPYPMASNFHLLHEGLWSILSLFLYRVGDSFTTPQWISNFPICGGAVFSPTYTLGIVVKDSKSQHWQSGLTILTSLHGKSLEGVDRMHRDIKRLCAQQTYSQCHTKAGKVIKPEWDKVSILCSYTVLTNIVVRQEKKRYT